MTITISDTVKNAKLDAVETAIGASAVLKLFDSGGSPPANEGEADVGTVVATINCPADYMAAGSGGSKEKAGTWQDTEADAAGDIDYFRMYASGGTCHMQGSAGDAGTEDLVLDNASVNAGQQVTITQFTWTEPG